MLNDILWLDHIRWRKTDQTLYQTRPFTEFWVVSIEYLRLVWHTDRERLLLQTPGPVPLGHAYVLLVETNPFSELVIFPDYARRISLVLSRFCFEFTVRDRSNKQWLNKIYIPLAYNDLAITYIIYLVLLTSISSWRNSKEGIFIILK